MIDWLGQSDYFRWLIVKSQPIPATTIRYFGQNSGHIKSVTWYCRLLILHSVKWKTKLSFSQTSLISYRVHLRQDCLNLFTYMYSNWITFFLDNLTWERQLAANAADVVNDVKNVALPAVLIEWAMRASRLLALCAWRKVLMKTNTSSTPIPIMIKSEMPLRIPRLFTLNAMRNRK